MRIRPGDLVDRAAIHAEYGGQTGSRIAPSKTTPNVFLFLDSATEERNGAICGLAEDGAFHMVGEGTSGDHGFRRGNLMLLAHRDDGRPLRLFLKHPSGQFRFMGTFELDRDLPMYRVDLPEEREPLVVRDAFVFRLRPVGEHAPLPATQLARRAGAHDPRMMLPSVLLPVGDRDKTSVETEAEHLLSAYCHTLSADGHDVVTVRIPLGAGTEMLGVPLLDRTTDTVVISPGSTSRRAVWAAIGEAMDCQRLTGAANAMMLLPSEPRGDVLALMDHVGLVAAWPNGREWRVSREPSAVPGLG